MSPGGASLYATHMAISRIRTVWSNFSGAPGYTNLFCDVASEASVVPAVRSFFNALIGILPSGVTIQVPGSGDTIDESTGLITGAWSTTTPASVVGTSGGVNTGASGAVVHWLTSSVVNGRRVRGRSFICPLASTAFDTAGTLTSAAITTLQTAADGLVTASAGELVVFHRPTDFAQGSEHVVTSTRVPDLAAVLRSRRQ